MDAPQVDPVWLAHAKLAFASLCGGMLRLFLLPVHAATPTQALFMSAWMLFGCVTCGFYGTPALMQWWNIDESFVGGVGAVIGLIGLSIAGGLLKAVEAFEFKAWFTRMMTKGNGA